MDRAILSSNIVYAAEKHQAEEREQLPSIIVRNLCPCLTFRLFKKINDSQLVKEHEMAKSLEFLFTLNIHEFGCLQTKTSWVTKSNLSVSTATQLIVAPNDYDYATFSIGRQKLSVSSKPRELYFHRFLRPKQHISPTADMINPISSANVLIRSNSRTSIQTSFWMTIWTTFWTMPSCGGRPR